MKQFLLLLSLTLSLYSDPIPGEQVAVSSVHNNLYNLYSNLPDYSKDPVNNIMSSLNMLCQSSIFDDSKLNSAALEEDILESIVSFTKGGFCCFNDDDRTTLSENIDISIEALLSQHPTWYDDDLSEFYDDQKKFFGDVLKFIELDELPGWSYYSKFIFVRHIRSLLDLHIISSTDLQRQDDFSTGLILYFLDPSSSL